MTDDTVERLRNAVRLLNRGDTPEAVGQVIAESIEDAIREIDRLRQALDAEQNTIRLIRKSTVEAYTKENRDD